MEFPALPALLPPRPADAMAAKNAPPPVTAADFESFLRLLTTQLRNQDPLQPIDSTEFVAQLASFASVEQLIQANDRLDALAARVEANLQAELAGWIGHAASATDGRFRATGGEERFRVPPIDGAQRIEAVVYRGDEQIDRFDVLPDPAGEALWQGAAGLGIAPGTELRIELVYHGPDAVIDRRPAPVFRRIMALHASEAGPVFELEDGSSLPANEIAELRLAA